MRKRSEQLNIRLTAEETARLKSASRRARLTASAYVRMLISGYCPKAAPPQEYEKLLQAMAEVHALLTATGLPDSTRIGRLLLQFQVEMTQPEKI